MHPQTRVTQAEVDPGASVEADCQSPNPPEMAQSHFRGNWLRAIFIFQSGRALNVSQPSGAPDW